MAARAGTARPDEPAARPAAARPDQPCFSPAPHHDAAFRRSRCSGFGDHDDRNAQIEASAPVANQGRNGSVLTIQRKSGGPLASLSPTESSRNLEERGRFLYHWYVASRSRRRRRGAQPGPTGKNGDAALGNGVEMVELALAADDFSLEGRLHRRFGLVRLCDWRSCPHSELVIAKSKFEYLKRSSTWTISSSRLQDLLPQNGAVVPAVSSRSGEMSQRATFRAPPDGFPGVGSGKGC